MYKFRFKFILSDSIYFNVNETSLCFNIASKEYILKSAEEKNISNSSVLILSGTGFNTREEAQLCGSHLMNVFRMYSIRSKFGLNLGNNNINGGFTDYFRDLIYKETGQIILNEIDGLMVYEDKPNIKVASFSANAVLTKDIGPLIEEVEKFHDNYINLSDNLLYAIEFYNLTHFNPSTRVKFLLYVITIETLIKAKDRREDVINHVNTLIALTRDNKSLQDDEIQSLISSLGYLRMKSISESGRNLVNFYLGEKSYYGKRASKFFTDCYNIRSKLVHYGKWDNEYESISNELGNMVNDLLLTIIEKECANK